MKYSIVVTQQREVEYSSEIVVEANSLEEAKEILSKMSQEELANKSDNWYSDVIPYSTPIGEIKITKYTSDGILNNEEV